MWKRGILLVLICSWLFTGCSSPQTEEQTPPPVTEPEENGGETIPLQFSPVPVEALEPTDPPVELVKVKSFGFSSISGSKQVMIHLYVDPQFKQNTTAGEVIVYLEEGGNLYNLGMASDNGVDSVNVVARDSNGDGKTEIEVSGLLGSHYVELKVIGFQRDQWVTLLTTGTAERLDLEQNGKPILVSVSAGTVPGYVWIYRWASDHFEVADVAESTGNTYAHVEEDENQIYIVAGTEDDRNTYTYSAGNLIKQEK